MAISMAISMASHEVNPLVIVLVLAIVLVAWCALQLAGEARAAGYWADRSGKLFRVYPVKGKLVLQTGSGDYGTKPGATYPISVSPFGVVVTLPAKKLSGWLSIDGRRLHWTDGADWIKQRL